MEEFGHDVRVHDIHVVSKMLITLSVSHDEGICEVSARPDYCGGNATDPGWSNV